MTDYSHLHDNKDICDNKCTQNISKVTSINWLSKRWEPMNYEWAFSVYLTCWKCRHLIKKKITNVVLKMNKITGSDHQHRRLRMKIDKDEWKLKMIMTKNRQSWWSFVKLNYCIEFHFHRLSNDELNQHPKSIRDEIFPEVSWI